MKKDQAIKLWNNLRDSTNVKEVINRFVNKKGYGGERTLVRYSQASAGFKEGLSNEDIATKTGWGIDYIEQIHTWWIEEYPEKVTEANQVSQLVEEQPLLGPITETPKSKINFKQESLTPKQVNRGIEHDIQIFQKSDNIMNERKFEILVNLLHNARFFESQLNRILQFLDFFHYESNNYVDFQLRHLSYKLCIHLNALSEFIQKYSVEKDIWENLVEKTEYQSEIDDEWHRKLYILASENHKRVLDDNNADAEEQEYLVKQYPPYVQSEYNDLIKKGELKSEDFNSKYNYWIREFETLINDLRIAHSEYRAAVRDMLFL
jgi:hypothetical protein